MKLISYNPSQNFKVLGTIEKTKQKAILEKIKTAKTVQKDWQDIGLIRRVEIIRGLHSLLEKNSNRIAMLASQEMGMPITQSRDEVASGLSYLDWYLNNAEKYLSPETTFENDTEIHQVFYEPKGVVVSITPWNYPFSNFIWQSCQNIIVGNSVINKPDQNTPLTYKLLEEIIDSSDVPKGVLQFIYGGKEIGKFLVQQDIDMICFTGSTKTGGYLYKQAAKKMIPIVLELGGSAPGLVFEDADIDAVIDSIFFNRFSNCGQICDGLKRLIVHESKMDEVLEKLTSIVKNQVIGDASDERTTIGPLVNKKQLSSLIKQLEDAKAKGAKVIFGGKRPAGLKGSYFEPTILCNITKGMKVWKEEVFGPILPVVSFKTEEQAIQLANDTEYGLGGYVFTTDHGKFARISSQIKTGMVAHNNLTYLIPCNPFGGCQKSGLGRNHGKYGFRDLCDIKVIAFEKSA